MTHTERMEELLEAERAAEWLQRLETGGPEVHAEFARWLRESPRHVREVLLASAIRHALKDLKAGSHVNVAEIRAKVAGSIADINLPAPSSPNRNSPAKSALRSMIKTFTGSRSERAGWHAAAILAFAVLLSFTVIAIYALSDRAITTAAGEWRDVPLADGSLLRAGPRTRVKIDVGDRERVVRLVHGEVMVYVAKDPARPFFVQTDLATARAVGTAFAVQEMERGRVSITVKEGTVRVTRASDESKPDMARTQDAAIILKAGERTHVIPGGQRLQVQAVDVDRELGWVNGRLVLSGTIADAIHQFNLRNRTQIELLDPEVGKRRLVGIVEVSDPMSLVKMLENQFQLSAVERGRTLVLMPDTTRNELDASPSRPGHQP